MDNVIGGGTTLSNVEIGMKIKDTDNYYNIQNFTSNFNDIHYSINSSDIPNDSQYIIRVIATDAVGNASQGFYSFYCDNTSPEALILEPEDTVLANLVSPVLEEDMSFLYELSDNLQEEFHKSDVTINILDSNRNVIKTLLNEQEQEYRTHRVFWDFTDNSGDTYLGADTHYFVVTVVDEAGNESTVERRFFLDPEPPIVSINNIGYIPDTNPAGLINMFTDTLVIEYISNEFAFVFIQYRNINETTYFISKISAISLPDTDSIINDNIKTYLGEYIKDGLYEVVLISADMAGNITLSELFPDSSPLKIDRTPPVLYNIACQPFVILPTTESTTLRYFINESNDAGVNQGDLNVSVSIPELNKVWTPSNNSKDVKHTIDLDISSDTLDVGNFYFKITAIDQHGNISKTSADFVNQGISPSIIFPEKEQTLGKSVYAIKGTAVDPNWSNNDDFDKYELYCRTGNYTNVLKNTIDTTQWELNNIIIPDEYRDTSGIPNNQSSMFVENGLLGYINTTDWSDGEYSLLLISYEKNMGYKDIAVTNFYIN